MGTARAVANFLQCTCRNAVLLNHILNSNVSISFPAMYGISCSTLSDISPALLARVRDTSTLWYLKLYPRYDLVNAKDSLKYIAPANCCCHILSHFMKFPPRDEKSNWSYLSPPRSQTGNVYKLSTLAESRVENDWNAKYARNWKYTSPTDISPSLHTTATEV